MITSIGYRVKSKRGVQFRAWANKVLKEYLLKGYSVNQLDYSSLQQLDKRSSGVSATVYTSDKNDKISNDIKRHNLQYPSIDLKFYLKVHDRFLIIDDAIYLIGASLKDLGKKLFGFTKMESITAEELLSGIKLKS